MILFYVVSKKTDKGFCWIMKKFALSFLSSLFALGLVGNTAFASTSYEEPSESILHEVEEIANESESLDLIDVDELPEGTPFVKFDTIEEFEQALKELDAENEANQDEGLKVIEAPQMDLITPYSTKTAADVLKVMVKLSWNPLKSMTQPTSVTVNLGYKYTGSGTSKKFSSITKLTSYSLGFPTDWIQTSRSTSFYDSNKGVNVTINGYNLLGVEIAGQGVGAKVSDTLTFKYKLGGSKTVKDTN